MENIIDLHSKEITLVLIVILVMGTLMVIVPQLLRDSASIVGDVRVFGKLDYLEVWNLERFTQKLLRDPWMDEDGFKLSEHGI